MHTAGESPAGATVGRRRERSALWQDSGFFQDSFFGADSRSDPGQSSEFGAIGRILRGGVEVRELGQASSTPTHGGADDKPPPTREQH